MKLGGDAVGELWQRRGIAAKIHEINVVPEYTQRRLGSLMPRAALDTLSTYFSDSATIGLSVVCQNQPARRWYGSLGIAPIGETRTVSWGPRNVQIHVEDRMIPLGLLRERLPQ